MGRIAAIALAVLATAVQAEPPRESPQRLRAEAESFLLREARGLPGQITVEIGAVDGRLSLARCDFLQAFFPAGSRPWGSTTVGLRCPGTQPWTIYVPARVRVSGQYLIAARGLAPGQSLEAGDVVARVGDLTELPSGTLTELPQAQGMTVANRVAAGQPIRRDGLRAEKIVKNGQLVVLVANGQGFRVSSEGRALGDAAEGNLLHVRTASGTVVSGVVRPGPLVEVLN